MSDPTPSSTLDEIAAMFRFSGVLFAATELGVFDALPDEGASADDLARALGVRRLPLNLLLNSLVVLELLVKSGDRFALAPAYAPLLRSGPASYRERILEHRAQSATWMDLAGVVRGTAATAPYYEGMIRSPRAAQYLDGVAQYNDPYIDLMMDALGAKVREIREALDLGGGHGGFARRVLERYREAHVTILDLQHSLAYGEALSAAHADRDRLSFVVGDARELDLPDRFDLVMINDLLHYMDGDEKREVLGRALAALRPGGLLAITKFRLEDDEVTPESATLFSLRMFINTRASWLETDSETARLLEERGGRAVERVRLGAAKTLITARR